MAKSKKGTILRVKRGYNPNSSSIGSIVFAVPTLLLILSAIFGAATTFIFSGCLGKTDVRRICRDKAALKGDIE